MDGGDPRLGASCRQPRQAPGYAVEVKLGAGSYGEVWRATDLNTRRKVAIDFFTRATRLDFALLNQEVGKLLEWSTSGAWCCCFTSALDAFIAGQWDDAFALLHAVRPSDRGKNFLTGHILGHRREPPPGWHGVIPLDSK